jgi:hypothetical protein
MEKKKKDTFYIQGLLNFFLMNIKKKYWSIKKYPPEKRINNKKYECI